MSYVDTVIERIAEDLKRLEAGPCDRCRDYEREVADYVEETIEAQGEVDERDKLILILRGQLKEADERADDWRTQVHKLEEELGLAGDCIESEREEIEELRAEICNLKNLTDYVATKHDIKKLEAKAKAATQEGWDDHHISCMVDDTIPDEDDGSVIPEAANDMAFAVAASPPMVLSLISQLKNFIPKVRCHDDRVRSGPIPDGYCSGCGWGRTWHD